MNLKKLFSIVLSLLVCLNLPVSSVFASDKIEYVALGDSIASGFQPNEMSLKEGNYSDLIKKYLEKKGKEVSLKNYAKPGQTTQGLKDQLEDLDISKADIITLSIGSNNMLGAFTFAMLDIMGIENEIKAKETIKEIFKDTKGGLISSFKEKKLVKKLKNANILNYALIRLEKELESVVDNVRSKNKDAVVIITNFYNPYAFVKELGLKHLYKYTNGMITKMNDILEKVSENKDFLIADVSFIGEDKSYLNIDLDEQCLLIDPHPNQKGHEAMSLAIEKNLENRI